MALPKFIPVRKRREQEIHNVKDTEAAYTDGVVDPVARTSSDNTLLVGGMYNPGVDIKRATLTRRNAVIASSFFFFVAVIFLILVEIGTTSNKPVLRNTWFFEVDLSNIFPTTTEDFVLVNSVTRSIGLHDFYNVGLWGFCEGYYNEGTTYCSPPKVLYGFNPVEIILSELFAGATVAFPSEINDILELVRVISRLMFGFFLTGVCVSFVSIFLAFLPLYSRWWSLPITIFTFIGALLTIAGTVIATVYAIVLKNAVTSQDELMIGASYGVQMWAFMWTASACIFVAFMIQLCLSCCCASRRDVKTGRKKGSRKAYGDVPVDEAREKPKRFKFFSKSEKAVV